MKLPSFYSYFHQFLYSQIKKDCNQRRKEHEYWTNFYKSNQNKYAAVRQKNIRNVEEILNHWYLQKIASNLQSRTSEVFLELTVNNNKKVGNISAYLCKNMKRTTYRRILNLEDYNAHLVRVSDYQIVIKHFSF